MIELCKKEEFDDLIKSGKVVVDFYAEWCGPCKMMVPIIEEVSKNHDEINFISINVDDYRDLAKRFGILSIPHVKLFIDGKEINYFTGYMDKDQLEEFIK